ncbi:MAG: hypothetical protein WCR19_00320 [Acholeplasmataceae bacterium]
MALQCKSCGYSLSDKQKECPYCGTKNDSYKEPEEKKYQYQNNQYQNTTTSTSSDKKDDGVDVCVLIVLIIVFWPAAIIYAIVKSKN